VAIALTTPTMQILIPFLFVFAVVFGMLELTHVFKNRAVEAVIAVALALFAATQPSFTTMLMTWLPSIVSFFVIIFFIAFLLELTGIRKAQTGHTEKAGLIGVSLLILFAIGGVALSQFGLSLPFIGGPENILFLLGLVFIVALFWFAFKIGEGVKVAPQQKKEKEEGG